MCPVHLHVQKTPKEEQKGGRFVTSDFVAFILILTFVYSLEFNIFILVIDFNYSVLII